MLLLDRYKHAHGGVLEARYVLDVAVAVAASKGLEPYLFAAPEAGFFLGRGFDLLAPDAMYTLYDPKEHKGDGQEVAAGFEELASILGSG